MFVMYQFSFEGYEIQIRKLRIRSKKNQTLWLKTGTIIVDIRHKYFVCIYVKSNVTW